MAGLTFGDMVRNILWRTGPGRASNSRLTTAIKEQVNSSHRVICAEQPWEWLGGRDTIEYDSTSTYLDLPSDCRNVVLVTRSDTGLALPHQREAVEAIQRGDVRVQPRGSPFCWDTVVNADASGQSLILIPFPASAGSVDILYLRLCTVMTQDADQPLLPLGHRDIIIEDSVAKYAPMDSYDPGIASRAWATRKQLMRALKRTGPTAQPPFHTLRWLGDGAWRP